MIASAKSPGVSTIISGENLTVPQRLIAVCSGADFEVWKAAYSQIKRCVRPEQVWVIVPDEAVKLFEEISHSDDLVVPESSLASQFLEPLEARLNSVGKINRLGWYLQQFLKLAALRESSHLERILLWDADTVPVRRLRFFTKTGSLVFYPSRGEYHLPYFRAIDSLLGLDRLVGFSFVSQCFPITGSAVSQFWERIESRSEGSFWETLLAGVQWEEDSGFSEYEALGTFLTHVIPESIKQSTKFWRRNGWHYFHSPQDTMGGLSRILGFWYPSYVSFEKWAENSAGDGEYFRKKSVLWISWQPIYWAIRRRLHGRIPPSIIRILRSVASGNFLYRTCDHRLQKRTQESSHFQFLETLIHGELDLNILRVGGGRGYPGNSWRDLFAKPGNYRATLLEPNPVLYEELEQLYVARTDLKVRQVTAGSKHGTEILYYLPKNVALDMNEGRSQKNWAFGLSSFSKADVVYWIHKNSFRGRKYRRRIRRFVGEIRETAVIVVPISELLSENPSDCLLLLGAKGFEKEVIAALDSSNLPRWVVIEDCPTDSLAQQALEALGYNAGIGGHDSVFQLAQCK